MKQATKIKGKKLFDSIEPTCPPGLLAVIKKHNGYTRAASAMHMSKDVLARVATGAEPMNDKLRAALMAEGADPHDAPTPARAPAPAPDTDIQIPPWNGKVAPHSYITRDNKKVTIKKMPVEFALLLKRERGVLNNAAKAVGYSGWTSVRNIIETGKYDDKLHANTHRALAGLPVKTKTNGAASGEGEDKHLTGFVVCVVSLAEYERLEELADIMGGNLILRMASGAGTLVIYRIHDRTKRETFKRLAQRDAKKIVCP